MAELCSGMPTAGGLYYAAAVLAPEGWGPLLSWVRSPSFHPKSCTLHKLEPNTDNGMVKFCWSLHRPLFRQLRPLGHGLNCSPNWQFKSCDGDIPRLSPHGSSSRFEGFLTMNSTKFIGNLNKIGTIVNLVVVVIFIVWMPAGSVYRPRTNPNSIVWTSEGVVNGTEWPTGFAFQMGFLSVIWTMSGYDAPFHLSEECSDANIANPAPLC